MTTSPDHLACGARVDLLLDQVSEGRAAQYSAHQAGCPHCQAALAEYDRLWAPIRETAATELRAPDSLLEKTFARLRAATGDPEYATLPGPQGATRIAARVVVVTARESAQDVAGVRVALSRVMPASDVRVESVVAGVAGRSTAIEISLAADYGVDLNALGDTIRAHVARRVRELTGLDPAAVTVHIEDVFT